MTCQLKFSMILKRFHSSKPEDFEAGFFVASRAQLFQALF